MVLRITGSGHSLKCKTRMLLRIFQADDELIKDIRMAVNKGLALGGERFKDEIERLHNRRVRPTKMGRPRFRLEAVRKRPESPRRLVLRRDAMWIDAW